MRPILVFLERLCGPLKASLTALGDSWGALGRVLGALRGLLGTPLLWKPFIFEQALGNIFGALRELLGTSSV